MILLQEAGKTVTFDVQSLYPGNPPWYEKLFVFYLVFMLIVLLARAQQLAWNLARLRRLQREGRSASSRFRAIWLTANAHADSLLRFSVLTLVLVLADFCMAAAHTVALVATQKVEGTYWVSIDTAQQLRLSAFGLLVCAALYAASFFFHGRLVRRELSFAKESSEGVAEAKSLAAPKD
jgi:hypothetical protein